MKTTKQNKTNEGGSRSQTIWENHIRCDKNATKELNDWAYCLVDEHRVIDDTKFALSTLVTHDHENTVMNWRDPLPGQHHSASRQGFSPLSVRFQQAKYQENKPLNSQCVGMGVLHGPSWSVAGDGNGIQSKTMVLWRPPPLPHSRTPHTWYPSVPTHSVVQAVWISSLALYKLICSMVDNYPALDCWCICLFFRKLYPFVVGQTTNPN